MQERHTVSQCEKTDLQPLVSSPSTKRCHLGATSQGFVVLLSQLLHNTLRIPSEFYHLRGLRKDTNCRSELKPVFIYTGIHMFVSCSIIFKKSLNKGNQCFYALQSCTI